ncbi:galactose oxidase, putative [Talaromyces stipitatus ATCC 10500]|uniref:Galactose oxidase, putative n=1 Tax=Talaromyces stipitatus (strain ATCC 10500 / CBS 375.48 / QM 6759 / NRRL 1006) TaxID=441959 RepID=B8MB95_TALSN|nr:galactose oxidase, putative [Talaromyces stipitatus ATCC 10500]EED18884.1 galactose oxidase, putative [Talaromyces stipitatus ATCC 10500]
MNLFQAFIVAFGLVVGCVSYEHSPSNATHPWSERIDFPLIPVAVSMIPQTGDLVIWSAYKNESFGVDASGVTQTAIYNLTNGTVAHYSVDHTEHDMFCPGISLDFKGRIIVSGGDTEEKTSIFDGESWKPAADMKIPRGYQASTTITDGRIFTIGGSFSGGIGGKDGEIYDLEADEWTLLPGCSAEPMLTKDAGGLYRSDNHAWLFAWSNGSVLQAGPSPRMHWFDTRGNGSMTFAGTRANDSDAMTGMAVIIATSNAHLITVRKPGEPVNVEALDNMHSARAFANAVILPDGKVFIVGGQSHPIVFTDENASMIPEMWDPKTKKFTELPELPTPRNYHSSALLLPNATVFVGGGGLCPWKCDANHLDAHIYTPPYLFESDGVTPATRPIISHVANPILKVGQTINVTLSKPVESNQKLTFSMVRMASSTHTVNTDQRRVNVSPQAATSTLFTLGLPRDPGVLLPGYWHLFAMLNGVPSEAETILVEPPLA